MKPLTLFLALVLATTQGCVVLDVVEGFRQFSGKDASRYADWRTRQLEKRAAKKSHP